MKREIMNYKNKRKTVGKKMGRGGGKNGCWEHNKKKREKREEGLLNSWERGGGGGGGKGAR